MSKKFHKLERLVQKMEVRYGHQDEAVLQLMAALDSLQTIPRQPLERRRFDQSGPKFLSPAKQMYYALSIESNKY